MLVLGKNIQIDLESPWRHPKFAGRFLPSSYQVSDADFDAQWRVSSFSSSVIQNFDDCGATNCNAVFASSFGVHFIQSVDIYHKTTRAAKYAILFVVLSFVSFFLVKTLSPKVLHPVQYALVGFALAIFYLLLLSLAEHIDFAWAYTIATLSCGELIGIYLKGVLGSVRYSMAYGVSLGSLYGMLYMILRSEDFALLMGSFLIFAVLAMVMIVTRKIDWYRVVGETLNSRGGKTETSKSLP